MPEYAYIIIRQYLMRVYNMLPKTPEYDEINKRIWDLSVKVLYIDPKIIK